MCRLSLPIGECLALILDNYVPNCCAQVVELKPDWPKGYSRLGAAHYGLHQHEEAIEAYKKGDFREGSCSVVGQTLALHRN